MVTQDQPMSAFAATIYRNKYAHDVGGRKEEWPETARRVVNSVLGPYMPDVVARAERLVVARKLMPGGRYLYAAGREYPQINSCFLFRAEDSREGWAEVTYKAVSALMTGGGIGVVYSDLRPEGYVVRKMGGMSTGPGALAQMINENGRYIMQGGSRRSAIWGGVHWHHPDVLRFIGMKDWSDMVRECKTRDFNFPAPMDGTNISVILDDDFFAAYADPEWSRTYRLGGVSYTVTHADAQAVYWACVRGMLRTGEPGFSIDTGTNEGENLRNACVVGSTLVATADGRVGVPISDLVGTTTRVYGSGSDGNIGVGVLGNVRLVQRKAPVVRVTMMDGSFVRLTGDHLVMLLDGSFVEAGSLAEGIRLMPFWSKVVSGGPRLVGCGEDVYPDGNASRTPAVASVRMDGVEDVYDGTVPGLGCFAVVTNSLDASTGACTGIVVHNCTEVCSADDGDMCNLSSVNLSRIDSIDEMAEAVEVGVALTLCGTLYARLPMDYMYRVREKNRRLGLGLMGVHEWLLRRGCRYGPTDELARWMSIYAGSGAVASALADRLGISRPVATRSVAPTGTISIVAETTSGVEPVFAVALKRRYLHGKMWKAQYIVDATAQRLIDTGVDPALIEDAMTLSEDCERRIGFQAWLQSYVDHGVASTINLPPWGSANNNEDGVKRFGQTLLKYLPRLRGITAYPDGSRGGQPLTRVPYTEAIRSLGVEFDDHSEAGCKSGVCGV